MNIQNMNFNRSNNNNWRGGRFIGKNGYVQILIDEPEHMHLVNKTGYAYEHRLVMEKKIGRKLRKNELVHHINGNRSDNREENLKLMKNHAEHFYSHRSSSSRLRKPGEPNELIECDCGCGKTIIRFDSSGRPRAYISGHNPIPKPLQNKVLFILENKDRSVKEITLEIGSTSGNIRTCLSKLLKQGQISRISRGVYIARVGKKAAGHLLDGVEHREMAS